MLRSSSATRITDEHSHPASAAPLSSLRETDGLPTFNPHSDIGKKAAQRARFAESTVHLIPAVIVLCAVVLWFFSGPDSRI